MRAVPGTEYYIRLCCCYSFGNVHIIVPEPLWASPYQHARRAGAVDILLLQMRKPRPVVCGRAGKWWQVTDARAIAPAEVGILGDIVLLSGKRVGVGKKKRKRFLRLRGRHAVESSSPRALATVVTQTPPRSPPSQSSQSGGRDG